MNRAVLWLVGGLGVLVLALVAIAPELLADLGAAGSAIGIALAAVVPAAIVAVLFVSTRRRSARRGVDASTAPHRDRDHEPHDHDPRPGA